MDQPSGPESQKQWGPSLSSLNDTSQQELAIVTQCPGALRELRAPSFEGGVVISILSMLLELSKKNKDINE